MASRVDGAGRIAVCGALEVLTKGQLGTSSSEAGQMAAWS